MAISQSKYVNIVSSIGGGSSVSQRELIGRVFSTNDVIPGGIVLEFGGGKAAALPAIADFFGMASAEYAFADRYFSFETAANTQPQKIGFARFASTAIESQLVGAKLPTLAALQAVTTGTLSFTVGETTLNVTGINLSADTSYDDVATTIATAIDAALVAVEATEGVGVTYNSEAKKFYLGSGDNLSYATGTIATLFGWVEGEAILGEAQPELTPAALVAASAEMSNNFFSFCILSTLTADEHAAVAAWVDSQNVKYMYSIGVTPTTYSAIQTAVKDYDGVAITLYKEYSYDEFMPMAAFAAVDYKKPNSTMDVFYKRFKGVTPSVTTNTERFIYDPLRINYYGTTQQAGQAVSFYQDGVLQGSIPSMTVYANEAWLKDAFITDILNLRMGLDSLPANNTGKSLVMSALMDTVNLALTNGVVLAGKELDSTQKAYITTITGDSDGWIAVQNAGYRLSAEIEKYTENGMDKYKISFLFVYSKGDTINYVDGRDILI